MTTSGSNTASSTTGPSVILVDIVTGLVAMAIATHYSGMSTIFPGAGGSSCYLSRTYRNRAAGFVVTWTKWLGYIGADAVLAIGFGSYRTCSSRRWTPRSRVSCCC